ncbi:MAG: hypothetical protein FJ020_05120 [Chloroflexi bacterium]|nr:hypothetical protein [Chloroflexota bacterium]
MEPDEDGEPALVLLPPSVRRAQPTIFSVRRSEACRLFSWPASSISARMRGLARIREYFKASGLRDCSHWPWS